MVSGFSTFARMETPMPSQCACSARASSTRRSPAAARSVSSTSWRRGRCARRARGSPGFGDHVQQRGQPDLGLPAAPPPAAAQPVRRADRHVPDLAGETVCAPDDPAVDDHAGADADRTGQVQQVRGAGRPHRPRSAPSRPCWRRCRPRSGRRVHCSRPISVCTMSTSRQCRFGAKDSMPASASTSPGTAMCRLCT